MLRKKILEKFIKTFAFVLFLFILLEITSWIVAIKIVKKEYGVTTPFHPFEFVVNNRNILQFGDWYEIVSSKIFRRPVGLQYNADPIIIFGCSFAYGKGLQDRQLLSYKLSEYTKRPVFNRAIDGGGIQHMLWQLRHEPFLDTIKNPKYIIYVWINDQMRRLDLYGWILGFMFGSESANSEYLRYKEKDGRLVEVHDMFPILRRTMLMNLIMFYENRLMVDKFLANEKFRKKSFELLRLHFLESKKIINEKYPEAKIIIIDYEDGWSKSLPSYSDFWKNMQKDGFIYLNTRREFGVGGSDIKYRLLDGTLHPNERAWDIIVPQLVRKL